MSFTDQARATEPFFRESADADELVIALRNAVRLNKLSMENLHDAIRICVGGLRADGMQCEAALLTMKASVRHMVRNHVGSDTPEILHSDLLMDQIVRWSIAEFYTKA
ncbi:MAG: hypothetical protein ABI556_17225 [Gemmatimonadales bacterium]